MTRWEVVTTDPMHPEPTARLRSWANLTVLTDPGVHRAAALAVADALIVRTPISVEDVSAGARLKLIVRHGAGLDFIPVDFARSRGVAVASVPDANSVSVAEYVIGAMLGIARSFTTLDGELRRGNWAIRGRAPGMQLSGRRLGVVGMGRIGRLVAERARAGLGMKVSGYDPSAADFPAHVERCDALDALIETVDVVTLHVPLTDATAGLIDEARLRRMKRGSYLVNAARGGIVDEAALARALVDGHLHGAAVDVFARQPLDPAHPLLAAPNVLLTPHAASLTAQAYRAMGMGSVEEVERAASSRPLLHPVHP